MTGWILWIPACGYTFDVIYCLRWLLLHHHLLLLLLLAKRWLKLGLLLLLHSCVEVGMVVSIHYRVRASLTIVYQMYLTRQKDFLAVVVAGYWSLQRDPLLLLAAVQRVQS